MLTNNGEKIEKKDIIDILKLKIENISIQIIPLQNNSQMATLKSVGQVFQFFFILFFLRHYLILQFK